MYVMWPSVHLKSSRKIAVDKLRQIFHHSLELQANFSLLEISGTRFFFFFDLEHCGQGFFSPPVVVEVALGNIKWSENLGTF